GRRGRGGAQPEPGSTVSLEQTSAPQPKAQPAAQSQPQPARAPGQPALAPGQPPAAVRQHQSAVARERSLAVAPVARQPREPPEPPAVRRHRTGGRPPEALQRDGGSPRGP